MTHTASHDSISNTPRNDHSKEAARALLEANYTLLNQVIRGVARRYRLSRDEAEEFSSIVLLRMVEDDYGVLRKFQWRSSLGTYLRTVVSRICLDCRTAEWGKWRPSAEAQRMGGAALQMERLMARDGLRFDEACEVLRVSNRSAATQAELDAIRARLPRITRRRRPLSVDAASRIAAPAAPDPFPPPRTVYLALGQALASLPHTDRWMLRLRFQQGWSIVRIARTVRMDQRAAYRRFQHIFRGLRSALSHPCGEAARASIEL